MLNPIMLEYREPPVEVEQGFRGDLGGPVPEAVRRDLLKSVSSTSRTAFAGTGCSARSPFSYFGQSREKGPKTQISLLLLCSF